MNYHLLIRTAGNIISSFRGSESEAREECEARNREDDTGTTIIHSSQETFRDHRREYYKLTD
jgi:hypothetical protein